MTIQPRSWSPARSILRIWGKLRAAIGGDAPSAGTSAASPSQGCNVVVMTESPSIHALAAPGGGSRHRRHRPGAGEAPHEPASAALDDVPALAERLRPRRGGALAGVDLRRAGAPRAPCPMPSTSVPSLERCDDDGPGGTLRARADRRDRLPALGRLGRRASRRCGRPRASLTRSSSSSGRLVSGHDPPLPRSPGSGSS